MMYQCLKVSNFTKDGKAFCLSKFLDPERTEVFTVYTKRTPPFEVGESYDLHFQPSFRDFNFLLNE